VVLDVYVGNLSARISVADLRELFADVAEQSAFGKGVRKGASLALFLSSIVARVPWAQTFFASIRKIPQSDELSFTMVDDARGQFARYCRISGYSRDLATRLITLLAGAGLQGQVLEVRPFYSRNLNNDRRRAGWRFHRWLGVERRVGERRHEK